MEKFKKRLQRFEENPPLEFAETLTNSIHNYFINELRIADENKLTFLLILGIHSTIKTLSEYIFNQKGIEFYLINFVDGKEEGKQFSKINEDINNIRNIVAHQFISRLGHSFIWDYDLNTGYKIENDVIHFNPSIYFDQFQNAFFKGDKTKYSIHDYRKLLSENEMSKAKEKFIKRFKER